MLPRGKILKRYVEEDIHGALREIIVIKWFENNSYRYSEFDAATHEYFCDVPPTTENN